MIKFNRRNKMKQIRALIMSLFIGIGFLAPSAMMFTTSVAYAADCADAKSCAKEGACALDPASCALDPAACALDPAACAAPETKINSIVKTAINILSVVDGIASVIMIILAGFKFVTSSGAPEKVSSARNTILYAVVGLVIVALAQIIVFFVLNQLKTPTP